MFENLSEKPIAEVQNEQSDKWEKDDLLQRCISTNAKVKPSFVFYEGPPTANGKTGYPSRHRENAEGFSVPLQDYEGLHR